MVITIIDYKKRYYELLGNFNDTIEIIDALSRILKQVQQNIENEITEE